MSDSEGSNANSEELSDSLEASLVEESSDWRNAPLKEFSHGACAHVATIPLTAKEKAIMAVINQLTDKPDWDKKVFDDAIADKWKKEAMAAPDSLITDITWDWCIKELHFKAESFQSDNLVCVLDAEQRVVKSDVAISRDLQNSLKDACQPLQDSRVKDWHPGSDGKVLNLVHPSLYPLVYERSLELDKPMTNVNQALSFSCTGRKTSAATMEGEDLTSPEHITYYSKHYQWLPCEVAFSEDDAVQITSYINNLHPKKHLKLYGVIEQFIAKAVPMFNKCLSGSRGANRRIDFTGPEEWDPPEPAAASPDDDSLSEHGGHFHDDPDWDYHGGPEELQWRQTRKLIWPEPDWDATNESSGATGWPWSYPEIDLRQLFNQEGLQVIVKMSSVELTPEKPSFDGGSWHLEGMQNEHIAATAIYYYDSENITDSCIEFRQATACDFDDIEYEQSEWQGLEQIFDTSLADDGHCIEHIGSVGTPAGRMIAFPNVLQHRVPTFQLVDPSKNGHRRILVLWLIDPHHRIKSTATIAPQQRDWWMEQTQLHSSRLPPEIRNMILDQVDWPMTRDEAEEIRLKLMEERTASINQKEEEMKEETYNFCEH